MLSWVEPKKPTRITPAHRERALKAYRLSLKGLLGKAIALAMGLKTAPEGNDLASMGYRIRHLETTALDDNELLVLRTLAQLTRERIISGAPLMAKHVEWRVRKYRGWVAKVTEKRLRRGYDYHTDSGEKQQLGFVHHSVNGHIWLTEAGWALIHAMESKR